MAITTFPIDCTFTDAKPTVAADTANMTTAYAGKLKRGMIKVTTLFGAFSAAAVTADVTLCTLPAKCKIVGIIADTTAAWTAAGTVALLVGTGAGAAEYLASHDVKTAVVTKGLADADMGTLLTRAAAINGGSIPSWSATTTVVARITSGTGNTSTITTGSTDFYIIVENFS